MWEWEGGEVERAGEAIALVELALGLVTVSET